VNQVRLLGDPVASQLRFTRYDQVGIGYGGAGLLVEREEDIAQTLAEAKRIAREEKKPVVVNAFLTKSSFREGSISL
jgi:glyoxylate carboligase